MRIRIKPSTNPQPPGDVAAAQFGRVFSEHMLVARFEDGEWKDPLVCPFDSFMVAPSNCTLHYGQAIFEGMKATRDKDGSILFFRPGDHHRRMNRSAARMCMPDIPETVFLDGLRELVRLDEAWVPKGPNDSLYIRPFYFGTDECIGVRVSENYTFSIITGPVGAYHGDGVKLWLSRENVRSHTGGTGDIKVAGNYGAQLHASRAAKQRGYDEVIWVDAREQNQIEECGTMNIFFVLDGTVVTPPLGGTILPGITRDTVLQILEACGVPTEEREVTVDELLDRHDRDELTECFGSGTAAGVTRAARIGTDCGRVIDLPSPTDDSVVTQLTSALRSARTGSGGFPANWTEALPSGR